MFGTNPAALLGTSWCPLATAVCNPPDNGSIAALLLFLRPELWRLATVAIQLRSIRCCPIVLAVSQRSRDSWPATCRVPHYRYSAETLSGAHRIAHSTQLDLEEHVARIDPCNYRDCQMCGRATPARSPSGEMRAESLPNGRHLDGRRSRIVRRRRCFYEAVEWLTSDERNRIDRLDARPAGIEQAIIRIEARLEATLSYLAAKANLVRIETVRTPLGDKRRAGKESVSIRPPASVTGLISILVR